MLMCRFCVCCCFVPVPGVVVVAVVVFKLHHTRDDVMMV